MAQERKTAGTGKQASASTDMVQDGQALPDDELKAVTGGTFSMLQNAFSTAIKSIGEGISTMARKG
jgi:hypothetical protein